MAVLEARRARQAVTNEMFFLCLAEPFILTVPYTWGLNCFLLCSLLPKNVKSAELLSQEMPGRFGQHRSTSWHMCTLVARARFEFPCIAFASLVSRLEEIQETFISAGAGSSSSPLPSVTLTDPSRSRKLGLSALTSGS